MRIPTDEESNSIVFCETHEACGDAQQLAPYCQNMESAWNASHRADWLLWILHKLEFDDPLVLRQFLVWCLLYTPVRRHTTCSGDLGADIPVSMMRAVYAVEAASHYQSTPALSIQTVHAELCLRGDELGCSNSLENMFRKAIMPACHERLTAHDAMISVLRIQRIIRSIVGKEQGTFIAATREAEAARVSQQAQACTLRLLIQNPFSKPQQ